MNTLAAVEVESGGIRVFARIGGRGPVLLLLHGFPQTHLMWRDIAPVLTQQFTVVCADLPGYGRGGCPKPGPDHEPHSKRAMARLLVGAMERLGFTRFAVAGHDRGGRVGYRMALDHAARVTRLAVLDVLPIETVWERADARLMLGFWPFSLLAQAAPLPEKILSAAADAVVDHALSEWGTPRQFFSPLVRDTYVEALRDPDHAQSICEEYRAAATIDREHDRADVMTGHKIACPVLTLWSARGPLAHWYADSGGPIGIWRTWAHDVRGEPIEGGHFFPEELPEKTAGALSLFFASALT